MSMMESGVAQAVSVCGLVAFIAAYHYIRSMRESDGAQAAILCGLVAFITAYLYIRSLMESGYSNLVGKVIKL